MPCGWSLRRGSAIRSTTLTTRVRKCGSRSRRIAAAATVSIVTTSPAQASTMSGSADAVVGAGPRPHPCAARAVLDRLVHRQPLQLRLLVDDDQVDVAARAEAVVRHGQQAVRVRRQVDPADVAPGGDDVLDQARPLVAEPVVVVAPRGRGEQDVEARDLGPPRQVVGLLQPLAVLDRLRRAHHREGLVGGEPPVPAGQRVALEPAVAVVLRQHLHDPAVPRQGHVVVGDPLGERRGRSPRTPRRAGCCWSRRDRTAGRGRGCVR